MNEFNLLKTPTYWDQLGGLTEEAEQFADLLDHPVTSMPVFTLTGTKNAFSTKHARR